jgi:hypothetical protein
MSKLYLQKLLQPLGTPHTLCPGQQISSIKPEKKKCVRVEVHERKEGKEELLTSSEETVDA